MHLPLAMARESFEMFVVTERPVSQSHGMTTLQK